jgi:hypothetical protein
MTGIITKEYYRMLPFRRACEAMKYYVTLPWVLWSNTVSTLQGKPLQNDVHVS